MVIDRSKDYIQQIADYIKKNLSKGYTLDALRFSLISQGYSRLSVENAINVANEQLAAQAPPMKEKPQITYKVITDDETYVYEKNRGFFRRLLSIFKRK
jgi:superfamily I DNA and/or RNA helicase